MWSLFTRMGMMGLSRPRNDVESIHQITASITITTGEHETGGCSGYCTNHLLDTHPPCDFRNSSANAVYPLELSLV